MFTVFIGLGQRQVCSYQVEIKYIREAQREMLHYGICKLPAVWLVFPSRVNYLWSERIHKEKCYESDLHAQICNLFWVFTVRTGLCGLYSPIVAKFGLTSIFNFLFLSAKTIILESKNTLMVSSVYV